MDVPAERLPPVSTTAVGVAAIRAAEATRTDALFTDPLAGAFVRAAGTSWSSRTAAERPDRVAPVITWVRVRTRFLDELLLDACARGCRQVVILGAGLDARAFRLDWPPGVSLFELDLPEILSFKQSVVQEVGQGARCGRVVVPTDLAGDWFADLVEAGFDPAHVTTWIAEGLLAYLAEASRDALIDRVTEASVPGSRLGLTLAGAERAPRPRPTPGSLPSRPGDYIALWQSEPPPDVDAWLGSRGWTAEVSDAYERGAAYGLPTTATEATRRHARLVDATRL